MSSSRLPAGSARFDADAPDKVSGSFVVIHRGPLLAAAASLLTCAAIASSTSRLSWWALALTLTQATAMLACSRDLRVGWALGLWLQAPWVTYDVVTGQYSFIAMSVIVSIAHVFALRRLAQTARALSQATSGPSSERALRRAGHSS